MLKEKTKSIDEFLLESFQNDQYKREIRLSITDIDRVKELYPKAKITKLPARDFHEEKSWYEIDILG